MPTDARRLGQRIFRMARRLVEAAARGEPMAPLTESIGEITLDEAYMIQAEVVRQRLARGETLVGVKLGLTSEAKQRQMGIRAPITGWLTDAMRLPSGGTIPRERLIHPRVEPEIVFVIGERLAGTDVTAEDVLCAVKAVSAGLEILDSRYADFRFQLPDVIADNASAAYFVVGEEKVPPSVVDLRREECQVKVNGRTVQRATGAAVMGHPAEAVAYAVRLLAERGLGLESGWMVLTGGLGEALPLASGDVVEVHFTNLGSVKIVCP